MFCITCWMITMVIQERIQNYKFLVVYLYVWYIFISDNFVENTDCYILTYDVIHKQALRFLKLSPLHFAKQDHISLCRFLCWTQCWCHDWSKLATSIPSVGNQWGTCPVVNMRQVCQVLLITKCIQTIKLYVIIWCISPRHTTTTLIQVTYLTLHCINWVRYGNRWFEQYPWWLLLWHWTWEYSMFNTSTFHRCSH